MYFSFTNPGSADILALTTFGVSAKESKSPIGQFGTGFKYALAWLLRNNCSVRVQTAGKTHTFSARPASIRGQSFHIIHMDSTPIGCTAELGPNWEAEHAYRELHSNMLDEGGHRETFAELPEPTPDLTRIIISGDAFAGPWENYLEIFPTGFQPFAPIASVIPKPSNKVYYKGVLIHTHSKPFAFTWNFHNTHISLTEDRTLKYVWELESQIKRAFRLATNADLIARLVSSELEESTFNYDLPDISEAARTGMERAIANGKFSTAFRQLYDRATGRDGYTYLTPTTIQQAMLNRACDFLLRHDFPIKHPVRIVESLGNIARLALADSKQGQILLTPTVFLRGTKYLAATLLEERLHLIEGLDDESRDMQNFLFDLIVSAWEELEGAPL